VRTTVSLAILTCMSFLVSPPIAAAPPSDIKAYCAGQWAEYRMQAYCIEKEESARQKLANGVNDQAIWARCHHKWDSWRMAAYCVEREEEAKAKVEGRQHTPPPTPLVPQQVRPPALPPAAAVQPAVPDYDQIAVATCGEFLTGAKRIADGVASSPFQMELEMRSVYRRAEGSTDRLLQQKAGALVREAVNLPRVKSATPFLAAVNDFAGYCRNTVLRGPATVIFGPTGSPAPTIDHPRPPAKPITQEEAEAMTKRATEHGGGKKCETKVYGGGAAVTVCE
jgi:hypothetical protein